MSSWVDLSHFSSHRREFGCSGGGIFGVCGVGENRPVVALDCHIAHVAAIVGLRIHRLSVWHVFREAFVTAGGVGGSKS